MAEYMNKELFLSSMGLRGDETKYGNRDGEHQHRSYSTYMSYEIMDCVEDSIVEDVAPVVHCKECKHWHEETGWCNEHSHFIDSEGAFCKPWESSDWKMFDADYFCKDGERKEGDADVRPKEEADEG